MFKILLRDFYAGCALTGFLAAQLPAKGVTNNDYAKDSFDLADTMMSQRERRYQ